MKWTNYSQKIKLPQLIQYKIDNLNSPVTIKKIEFIILKLPQKKSPDSDVLLENFNESFRININSTQSLSNNRRGGNIFQYEVSMTLIPKPGKDSTKKKTMDHYSS